MSITTEPIRRESDLSPGAADRMRRQVPDEPVRLPAGSLACQACGVAVAHDEDQDVTAVTALGRAGEPPRAPAPHGRPELEAQVTTCPGCAARQDTARRIVRRFPSLTARLGPFGATHRTESALNGLAALHVPMPDPDAITPAAVGSLLNRMSGPGAGVAWSGMLAPVQLVPPNACSRYPWGHVNLSTRAALRGGYAGMLSDRVAASRPSQDLTPPDPAGAGIPVGGGCLLCGIGAITRTAAQVSALGGPDRARSEIWRPISAPAAALGGRHAPTDLAGHCCPDCSDAIDTTGSVGATAMARAFVRWLRSVGRDDDALRVERGEVSIVGWGAGAANARQRGHSVTANGEPWGHLQVGGPA